MELHRKSSGKVITGTNRKSKDAQIPSLAKVLLESQFFNVIFGIITLPWGIDQGLPTHWVLQKMLHSSNHEARFEPGTANWVARTLPLNFVVSLSSKNLQNVMLTGDIISNCWCFGQSQSPKKLIKPIIERPLPLKNLIAAWPKNDQGISRKKNSRLLLTNFLPGYFSALGYRRKNSTEIFSPEHFSRGLTQPSLTSLSARWSCCCQAKMPRFGETTSETFSLKDFMNASEKRYKHPVMRWDIYLRENFATKRDPCWRKTSHVWFVGTSSLFKNNQLSRILMPSRHSWNEI